MEILTSQLPKKEKEFWRNICNYTRKHFFSNKRKEPTKKKKLSCSLVTQLKIFAI